MASITGMLATAVVVPVPKPSTPRPSLLSIGGGAPSLVECSSRPQKKATAHHMKTRPKKTQPWDVRRKGPTAYPPLPVLPPDWTLAPSDSGEASPEAAAAPVAAPPV